MNAAARAANAEQQHRSRAARVQRGQNCKHMAARCNHAVFKPGFNFDSVARNDVGSLYGERGKDQGVRALRRQAL